VETDAFLKMKGVHYLLGNGEKSRIPDFLARSDADGKFAVQLIQGSYYLGTMYRSPDDRRGPPRKGEVFYFADDGNPSKPFLENIIGSKTIAIGGNIAFEVVEDTMFVVTAADKKFKVLDISDVNNPVVVSSANVSGQENSTVEIELDTERKLAFVSTKGYISVYNIRRFLP